MYNCSKNKLSKRVEMCDYNLCESSMYATIEQRIGGRKWEYTI